MKYLDVMRNISQHRPFSNCKPSQLNLNMCDFPRSGKWTDIKRF